MIDVTDSDPALLLIGNSASELFLREPGKVPLEQVGAVLIECLGKCLPCEGIVTSNVFACKLLNWSGRDRICIQPHAGQCISPEGSGTSREACQPQEHEKHRA